MTDTSDKKPVTAETIRAQSGVNAALTLAGQGLGLGGLGSGGGGGGQGGGVFGSSLAGRWSLTLPDARSNVIDDVISISGMLLMTSCLYIRYVINDVISIYQVCY